MIVKIGKYVTHVDKKYYLKFKAKRWAVRLGWNDTPYVTVASKLLSRLILQTPKGLIADHKNHNTLDNRRRNLRNATRSQNMWNRKRTCEKSKYKGVSMAEDKWQAQLRFNDKRVRNKACKTEREAALLYNKWAKEFFGEFACLNKV